MAVCRQSCIAGKSVSSLRHLIELAACNLSGHHFIPQSVFLAFSHPFKRAQLLSYRSRRPSFMCFLKLCAI